MDIVGVVELNILLFLLLLTFSSTFFLLNFSLIVSCRVGEGEGGALRQVIDTSAADTMYFNLSYNLYEKASGDIFPTLFSWNFLGKRTK